MNGLNLSRMALGAAAVTMTLACNQQEPTPAPASPTACAIALAPHQGDERVDRAIFRVQQQLATSRAPFALFDQLGWAYVAKARVSFDPGFYTLADQTARCMDSRQPSSPEAMLLRGHVLHQLHRFQEVEVIARSLVAVRGRSFDYGLLGDALLEQGKLSEAAEAYQEMMDEKPSPQAYARAAHLRWLKGDLAAAKQLMGMAASVRSGRDPESLAWALVQLGLFEMQSGAFDRANDHFVEALRYQEDYAPAIAARGRLAMAQGRLARAVVLFSRAVSAHPLPEYRWWLIEPSPPTETSKRPQHKPPNYSRPERWMTVERSPCFSRRPIATSSRRHVSRRMSCGSDKMSSRSTLSPGRFTPPARARKLRSFPTRALSEGNARRPALPSRWGHCQDQRTSRSRT